MHSKDKQYPMDNYPKLIINAAITGMVPTKDDSPHVPITEDEIVSDALSCWKAGASIVHLHVRDDLGRPDYSAERYSRIITRIRNESDVIICVSTSGRNFSEFSKRSEVLLLSGSEKPDMASLTLGSLNFPKSPSINAPEMIKDLAELMIKNGIRPEFEVFEPGMLNYLKYLSKKIDLPGPNYINLLLGSLGSMPARPKDLSHLIDDLPEGAVWSAAGIGVFQLPMNTLAIVSGGGVRVGLEDNIYFDYEKKQLATNEMLVKRVVRISGELNREISSAAETRKLLRLSIALGSRTMEAPCQR